MIGNEYKTPESIPSLTPNNIPPIQLTQSTQPSLNTNNQSSRMRLSQPLQPSLTTNNNSPNKRNSQSSQPSPSLSSS